VDRFAWSRWTSPDEVSRRAAGRCRYNALRRVRAQRRRRRVLELLARWGYSHGVQARIAAALSVSEATISRDMAIILPLQRPCPTCGTLVDPDRLPPR
jgi:hypothetical protein